MKWKDDKGVEQISSINDWILHIPTDKTLPNDPWIYGGSYIHHGAFQAKAQGEFAAVFFSRISLLNYSGKDHYLDDVWIPKEGNVPTPGTPITIQLSPYQQTKK